MSTPKRRRQPARKAARAFVRLDDERKRFYEDAAERERVDLSEFMRRACDERAARVLGRPIGQKS